MLEFLNSLETKQPALVDVSEINLEFVGKLGQGMNSSMKKPQFIVHLLQKCQRALQLYSPSPDLRPKLLYFSYPKENVSPKDSIPQNSYSKSNILTGRELLYRVYNSENKLVRSVLENSGFKYTETHLWNIL